MLPGIIVLLSVLFSVMVGLPLAVGISWWQGTPVDWTGWAFGVAGGVALGVALGVTRGVALGVAYGVGALRLPFFLLEFLPTLTCSARKLHPVAWDELAVLPLPRTKRWLKQQLKRDEAAGLNYLGTLARNPFQRGAVQHLLYTYLHQQPLPFEFLAALLTCPALSEFVFAPVARRDWELVPTVRQVLLGELAGRWVDCSSSQLNGLSERIVWLLTWFRRHHRQTPLTRFAGMLYELLDERTVNADDFDLSRYRPIYNAVTDYPYGSKVKRSFEAMVTFLSYSSLSSLRSAVEISQEGGREIGGLEGAKTQSPLQTLNAQIQNLQQVAAEIAVYQDSTSRVNKQAALLCANDILDGLDESLETAIVLPYQTLLRRIIRQWRRLISEEGGTIGRATETQPVDNPYIAGNPVTGQLFVGREDILTRLEELWCKPGQCESVVIYGHRRMGKSSILKNLGVRFGAKTTVVNFDMQLESHVSSTAQLLYDLAIALYDHLPEFQQQAIAEPTEADFASNPTTTLRRFLTKLDKIRQDWRFIITIDEFETIERKIQEGKLEVALLEFLRGLIYQFQWFILALAGLHTLEEMRRDYWNPLFGTVTAIPISFLTPKAANRLITEPSPDFDIDYERDALDRIIDLTHRQPYLMQLIGRELVTHFNRQTFEEGREGERRFTLSDVEAVVNAPEFYQEGNAYFQGVWKQAEKSQPKGQLAILQQLAQARQPLSIAELVEMTALNCEQVAGATVTLERHDVIAQQDGHYDYNVELMRRWVKAVVNNE